MVIIAVAFTIVEIILWVLIWGHLSLVLGNLSDEREFTNVATSLQDVLFHSTSHLVLETSPQLCIVFQSVN